MTRAALILAAGRSTRMGQPKLLLPWGNTTVLGQLLRLCAHFPAAQIAVVHAPNDAELIAELDRLHFPTANRIVNPVPARGMFSSIRCAAAWAHWEPEITHHAILLGDQPHLSPATLRAIAEHAAQHPEKITQPARNGHGRHPVILPAKIFRSLANTESTDLKQFLQSHCADLSLIEMPDPALDLDIDTPADYQSALKQFPTAA